MKTVATACVLLFAASVAMGAGAPSASGDPALDQNRVAAAVPAIPVRVVNSVTVDNLPLADDGSVRVTAGPRQAKTVEVLTAPIALDLSTNAYSPSVDVSGYSHVVVRFTNNTGVPWIETQWRSDPSDEFLKVHDLTTTYSVSCDLNAHDSVYCTVMGSELRFLLNAGPAGTAPIIFTSIKLYLIP